MRMTHVTEIRRVQIIAPSKIPEGDYPGSWSGYVVLAGIGNVVYELQTEDGVRGLNVPCTIKVRDGVATVHPEN